MTACVIGIDVGTGSARAGVFDLTGHMMATDSAPISMHREGHDRVEQSSTEIWSAICSSVRGAVSLAGIDAVNVAGIGFDATCSMVVQGQGGIPLPVGDPDAPERDVIVWMDHRAIEQARRINATGHAVLNYVGGRISPEMQTPKLLWLKENRPEVFDAAAGFFDLTDWFTWRATGSLARSVCTVTCKWTYLAHENRWDADYFHKIGLGDLADEGFVRIGTQIVEPGTALAKGLTEGAARDLGLRPGTSVAAGLIDAHAGGIGTVGAEGSPTENLAYVFGTSSCTMTTTQEPVFVPGVWGPYKSAMVPGAWLNEGGQSAAGAAIQVLLAHHPASAAFRTGGQSLLAVLADRARSASGSASGSVALARGIHVVPEFLGNRAPHADPDTRAVIAGLGMAQDEDNLVALYVAGVCGIGYGLRQIVAAQSAEGIDVKRILISGGAGKSSYVRQILADTTGLEVASPEAEEPVLLGSAILAAVAGGAHPSVTKAMAKMTRIGERYDPSADHDAIHNARFEIFCRLQKTMRKAVSV